jgi:hypothetical protein
MWSRKSSPLDTITLILIIRRSTATIATNTVANQANTVLSPFEKSLNLSPAAKAEVQRSSLVQLMIARPMSRIRTNGLAFSYDELLMTSASSYYSVHNLKHSRLRVFTSLALHGSAWSMGNMGWSMYCPHRRWGLL